MIKNKQDGEYTHYLTSVRLKAHTGGNVLASYQSGVTKLEGGGGGGGSCQVRFSVYNNFINTYVSLS